MKTIVFDLLSSQPAGNTKFHGGGEYIKTVFRYFVDGMTSSENVIVCLNNNKFIDDWIINLINSKSIEVKDVKNVNEIVEYLESISQKTQVSFFAGLVYAYRYITFPENVHSVGTCHGLRAIEKPTDRYMLKYISFTETEPKQIVTEMANFFFRRTIKKRHDKTYSLSISKFDEIITDSYHSLYSIQLNYSDSLIGKKIHVLYPMTQAIPDFEDMLLPIDDKYIMIISANRWIKNSFRACIAIDELYSKQTLKGIRTKVYGNLPRRIRKQIVNIEMFDFYDYVSSDELEKAYRECSVFLYPTLNEGFGNVPMEAMKYDKTCVVSGVCSLPEVYGTSVYYCNPYDIMEMKNRVLQALDNRIDRKTIDERLQYLYKRQKQDIDSLCSIIRGEQN